MKHDDNFGEDICEEEATMYRREVLTQARPPRHSHQRQPHALNSVPDESMARPVSVTSLGAVTTCRTDIDGGGRVQLKLSFLKRHEADGSGALPPARVQHAMRTEFPGSQPVSLSSENWGLLSKLRRAILPAFAPPSTLCLRLQAHCRRRFAQHHHVPARISTRAPWRHPWRLCRYWFTWKADGTRYMLYLSHSGTYLIDRRMKISRVQMRFPLWSRPGVATGTPAAMLAWFKLFDAGKLPKPQRIDPRRIELHHGTLLDGEMVVNDHPDGRQERVFYAYDLMMLQGVNVAARPWKVRYFTGPEPRCNLAYACHRVFPCRCRAQC